MGWPRAIMSAAVGAGRFKAACKAWLVALVMRPSVQHEAFRAWVVAERSCHAGLRANTALSLANRFRHRTRAGNIPVSDGGAPCTIL